jgi:hypothetical protein
MSYWWYASKDRGISSKRTWRLNGVNDRKRHNYANEEPFEGKSIELSFKPTSEVEQSRRIHAWSGRCKCFLRQQSDFIF